MKTCPLCLRAIPPHLESRHHLIPKLKGGTHGATATMHACCHSKIHAVFTEAELARSFDTVEKLRSHPEIAKFIRWLQRRPIDFNDGTPSRRRRRR